MLRDDSRHFDHLYQLADLLLCAGVLVGTLALPWMVDAGAGPASNSMVAFSIGSALSPP